jgi:hypothetical protein
MRTRRGCWSIKRLVRTARPIIVSEYVSMRYRGARGVYLSRGFLKSAVKELADSLRHGSLKRCSEMLLNFHVAWVEVHNAGDTVVSGHGNNAALRREKAARNG